MVNITFNVTYESKFEIGDIVIFKHWNSKESVTEKYIGIIEDIGFEKKGLLDGLFYYIERITDIEISKPSCIDCKYNRTGEIDKAIGCEKCKFVENIEDGYSCSNICKKWNNFYKTCTFSVNEESKKKYVDWCRTNLKTKERFVVVNYNSGIPSKMLYKEKSEGGLGVSCIWINECKVEEWDGELEDVK